MRPLEFRFMRRKYVIRFRRLSRSIGPTDDGSPVRAIGLVITDLGWVFLDLWCWHIRLISVGEYKPTKDQLNFQKPVEPPTDHFFWLHRRGEAK
jgi:hypothetical protein